MPSLLNQLSETGKFSALDLNDVATHEKLSIMYNQDFFLSPSLFLTTNYKFHFSLYYFRKCV